MAEVLNMLTTSVPGMRVLRAMSLPTLPLSKENPEPMPPLSPLSSSYPASPSFPEPLTCPDLPSDPRTWTSTHVAAYLTYCLRLYPPAIINDLSRYVREDTSLDGRRFLRLKEDQLRYMGFNERWVKLIMLGVKALRRESLKGKILSKGGGVIAEELEPELLENDDAEAASVHSDTDSGEERAFRMTSTAASTLLTSEKNASTTDYASLTADDRQFICYELDRLKDALQTLVVERNADRSCAPAALPSWLSRVGSLRWLAQAACANPREPLFASTPYSSGFAHGALVGGVFVWACCKVVANWRN